MVKTPLNFQNFLESATITPQKAEELTMGEYLEKVKETPSIAANAAGRVLNAIRSYGVTTEADPFSQSGDRNEVYSYFKSFYGIEDNIAQMMSHLKLAASGGDASRRLLLLVGPPGSGKSNIVTELQDALIAYTHTDQGAVYRIKYPFTPEQVKEFKLVRGYSPTNENPLVVIPNELRSALEDELGVHIEGVANAHTQYVIDNLLDGDWRKLKVERFYFSRQNRVGIGQFQPDDPKSQKASHLKGGEYTTNLGYFPLSHPLAYDYAGEINVANRGVMEFVEFLKVSRDLRNDLLTITQEKLLKVKHLAALSVDTFLIAHTNDEEYRKFLADKSEEATKDRMVVLDWRYNMRYEDEEKILKKMFKSSSSLGVHIGPNTLKTAALLGTISRFSKDESAYSILEKAKLYNGEYCAIPRDSYNTIRSLNPREGFSGLGPRKVVDFLQKAVGQADKVGEENCCVSPYSFLGLVNRYVREHSEVSDADKQHLTHLIKTHVLKAVNEWERKNVYAAIDPLLKDKAQEIFAQYMHELKISFEKTKNFDSFGEEIKANEAFINEIESEIGISSSTKQSFRQEIIQKVATMTLNGNEFKWDSHPRLKEAIEKHVEKKMYSNTIGLLSKPVGEVKSDKNLTNKMNKLYEGLAKIGYCKTCANHTVDQMRMSHAERTRPKGTP